MPKIRGYYSGLNTKHKELTRVLNRRDQLLIFASTNGGRFNNGMAPSNAVCPPYRAWSRHSLKSLNPVFK